MTCSFLRAGLVAAALTPALPGLAVAQSTDAASSYSTDPAFMALYTQFPRGQDSDSIGAALADAMEKQPAAGSIAVDGPLVIVNETGVYAYDGTSRALLMAVSTRNDPTTGFFELTSVSHIGPAIAYLAAIKQAGSDRWQPLAEKLLADIRAARAANARSPDWIDTLDLAAWQGHKDAMRRMMDYALWMAGDYLVTVLAANGDGFTTEAVGSDFYRAAGSDSPYPIPFNNVMVATFSLVSLTSADDLRRGIVAAGDTIDWANAKVVVHMPIGTNYGAGLTLGTNQVADALLVATEGALPAANVLIVPYADAPCPQITVDGKTYAEVGCTATLVGADPLDETIFTFYNSQVWIGTYDRTQIAENAFPGVGSIYLPGRPAIPGDYGVTRADDIDGFIERLKLSFIDSSQLLSNAVGFWVPGELAAKGWDPSQADIPGLTAGFPAGIDSYPASNPAIPE